MDRAECGQGSHLVYRARARAGYPSQAGVVQREQRGRFYFRSAVALTDAEPQAVHKWMSAVADLVAALAAAAVAGDDDENTNEQPLVSGGDGEAGGGDPDTARHESGN